MEGIFSPLSINKLNDNALLFKRQLKAIKKFVRISRKKFKCIKCNSMLDSFSYSLNIESRLRKIKRLVGYIKSIEKDINLIRNDLAKFKVDIEILLRGHKKDVKIILDCLTFVIENLTLHNAFNCRDVMDSCFDKLDKLLFYSSIYRSIKYMPLCWWNTKNRLSRVMAQSDNIVARYAQVETFLKTDSDLLNKYIHHIEHHPHQDSLEYLSIIETSGVYKYLNISSTH